MPYSSLNIPWGIMVEKVESGSKLMKFTLTLDIQVAVEFLPKELSEDEYSTKTIQDRIL